MSMVLLGAWASMWFLFDIVCAVKSCVHLWCHVRNFCHECDPLSVNTSSGCHLAFWEMVPLAPSAACADIAWRCTLWAADLCLVPPFPLSLEYAVFNDSLMNRMRWPMASRNAAVSVIFLMRSNAHVAADLISSSFWSSPFFYDRNSLLCNSVADDGLHVRLELAKKQRSWWPMFVSCDGPNPQNELCLRAVSERPHAQQCSAAEDP